MGGFAKGARMGTEGSHPFLWALFAEFPKISLSGRLGLG